MTAYESYPNDERIEICIKLEGTEPTAEWVRAAAVGPGLYRLDNVPFFASNLGLHDVVIAVQVSDPDEPEFDFLEVVDVVERVTHVRFVYRLGVGCERAAFLRRARELEVATECFGERAYVSNLRDRTHASSFQAMLEEHAEWFERHDAEGAANAGRR